MFVLILYSLDRQVMLVLILIDVQYSQKTVKKMFKSPKFMFFEKTKIIAKPLIVFFLLDTTVATAAFVQQVLLRLQIPKCAVFLVGQVVIANGIYT